MKASYWMDDRGEFVTDAFLRSDAATSDYRAAYNVPARLVRGCIRPLYPCKTCDSTGTADYDACTDCGGSGGWTAERAAQAAPTPAEREA